MTSQNTLSMLSEIHTVPQNQSVQNQSVQNQSVPHGCIEFRSKEMEYLPWNNADNIVNRQAALYASQVRSNILHICFLIGGPANVINMVVFFKQGLRDRVNLLLFSLSLGDESYLITAVLHYFEAFYVQFSGKSRQGGSFYAWLLNNFVTGFLGCIFISFVLSSIIACERCYCVLRPLSYQTALRTKTVALIIFGVYGVVLGLFFFVAVRYYVVCAYDPDTGLISRIFGYREFYLNHQDIIDYMDSILFGAGFPILTMVVVTTATVITTWKLRQIVAWRTESSSSVSAKEVALTKMLIGTSVLFIICASPGCTFRFICLFLPEMNFGGRNQNFYLVCIATTQMFFYVNCTFNFIVYYLMGSRYRKTFKALFRKKQELNKSNQ